MKRVLDVNAWIALTLKTHPHHVAARQWYGQTSLVPGDLVFCLPTELGFLRLVTQAAVMKQCGAAPLSNAEAVEFLSRVYRDPAVSRMTETPSVRDLWFQLAVGPDAAPNSWMDAYLAALAIVSGAEMVTFDRGFRTYEKSGLNLRLLESP